MKALIQRFSCLLVALLCILAASSSLAQGSTPDALPSSVKLKAELKMLQEDTEANSELSAKEIDLRKTLIEAIVARLAEISEEKNSELRFTAEKLDFEKTLETRSNELKINKKFLGVPPKTTLEEADEKASGAEAELVKAKAKDAMLRARVAEIEARELAIPTLIEKLDDEARALSSSDLALEKIKDSARVKELRKAFVATNARAIEAKVERLKTEKDSIAAEKNVRNKDIELVAKEIAYQKSIYDAYDARAQRLIGEAERAKLVAVEEEREQAPPALRAIADQTVEYSQEIVRLDDLIQSQRRNESEAMQLQEELEQRLKTLRERVIKAGSSESIGIILRRELRALPSAEEFESNREERDEFLKEAQTHLILLEESAKKISANPSEGIESYSGDPELKDKYIKARSNAIKDLIQKHNDAIDVYERVERLEKSILETRNETKAFIEEHILWIRSALVYGTKHLEDSLNAFLWLISSDALLSINLFGAFSTSPVVSSIWLFAVLVIIALGFPMRRRQDKIAHIVDKAVAAPWRFTFQAWIGLLTRSLAFPSIIAFLAWLVSSGNEGGFSDALSRALYSSAGVVAIFGFERLLCRPNGVGEVHFAWHTPALALFRRHIFWVSALVIPCLFLVKLFSSESSSLVNTNSLGRTAFILQSLGLMVFAHIVLRPQSAALEGLREKYLGWWMERFGPIWYLVVVGIPATFAGLAIAGYYYTALELSNAALRSVIALLLILQINALVSRWFFLYTRRMAIHRAKARRRSAALPQLSEEDIEQDKLTASDIKALRSESRSLRRIVALLAFGVSLYFIWSPVLPALRFLDNIDLWSFSAENGETTSVTLRDLISALIVAISTIIAVRTLPNLLEATVLRRFKVDRGGRYAVKAITRYSFTVIGILLTFSAIGVHWDDVQWLVAGLSVGLGFGLQEIFANFISGLIMFFERPVRVGDTVTVGDVSGTVTRINMRATTVLDWGNKELVVPNKMFVTDRLINWSLSDDVVRLVVSVGVAYGSDLELVEETLLDLAKNEPNVVDSPKPTVFFESFGDSTLNFELRAYVNGVDHWVETKDHLNRRIDARFRKANIEIAFPQRVLHFAEAEGKERILKQDSGDLRNSKGL